MSKFQKVLVVRAKPHNINKEEQFLDGILSIGWPTKDTLEGKTREEVEEIINNEFDNVKQLDITQIMMFIKLPIGSIVLTPSYKNRRIHVFETTSEYQFRQDFFEEGNPHTIQANYLSTIEREEFPEVIRRSLKAARKPVTNYSKYEEEINEIVNKIKQIRKSEQIEKNADNSQNRAKQALEELLESDNEEIKLQAALALLKIKK